MNTPTQVGRDDDLTTHRSQQQHPPSVSARPKPVTVTIGARITQHGRLISFRVAELMVRVIHPLTVPRRSRDCGGTTAMVDVSLAPGYAPAAFRGSRGRSRTAWRQDRRERGGLA
jgi:hypothetical protein